MSNKINTPQNTLFNKANEIQYAIDQSMMNINTILICDIEIVNADKSCDVRSVINLIDNSGNPITPNIIFNIPKIEIRGGIAGIIVEPIVGDKVVVSFCQRDISSIKKHLTRQNPASYRKFSLMDGIILGVISNTPPSIYVKITSTGVKIDARDQPIELITTGDVTTNCTNAKVVATTMTTVTSPTIKLDGDVTVTGLLTIAGIPFATHVHSPGLYNVGGTPVTGSSGVAQN